MIDLKKLDRIDMLNVLADLEINLSYLNYYIKKENQLQKKANNTPGAILFVKFILAIYAISFLALIPQIALGGSLLISMLFTEKLQIWLQIVLTVVIGAVLLILYIVVFKFLKKKADKIIDKYDNRGSVNEQLSDVIQNKNYYQDNCNQIVITYAIPSSLRRFEGVSYVNSYLNRNPESSLDDAIIAYENMCERRAREAERAAQAASAKYEAERIAREIKDSNDKVVQELEKKRQIDTQINQTLGQIQWDLSHK